MRSEPNPLRAWGAAALWAWIVWNLGDDGFSATHTSRLLGPLVAWLFPALSDSETASLLFFVRKTAHVFEYALLAGLTARALRTRWKKGTARTLSAAFGLVAAMAVADELRQGSSSARTGSGGDVLLDLAGAALGLGFFHLLSRRTVARPSATRDPVR